MGCDQSAGGGRSLSGYYLASMGEFLAWFATDAHCLEWLRWPDGFVCPRCPQVGGWRTGLPVTRLAGLEVPARLSSQTGHKVHSYAPC